MLTIRKIKFYLIPSILSFLLFFSCSKKDSSITEPDNLPEIPGAAYVYTDNTKQLIRGFGGVNMPGWIDDMTPEMINKAFGTGDGQIGLSILRIRVPYDNTKFNLEVPTAKAAREMGVTIIASPWSPPPSMKSNNNIVGGYLNDDKYADYAAHLKSFADYMKNNGAPLNAVSIQNEPDVSVNYESCDWNASQMVKFIKNNSASIGTKIIAPESYNFGRAISDAVLNDADAASKVDIIGGHIYGGGLAEYPLAKNKGKEIWMTEHLVLDTDWKNVLHTGKEIDDCMYYDMSAYLWWYIRRYYGPIDDNGNVTKRGFVISQYARFIRPGYYRIEATSSPQDDMFVSAYKSDSKIIIVAINMNSTAQDQTFYIQGRDVAKFTPYTTTSDKNCERLDEINVSEKTFTANLRASSITTFVSN